MSIDYDEDLAAQNAVEDAKYEDLMGPGDEPPEEYLAEEAANFARWHRDDVHGGGECDCPVPEILYSTESPF